MKILVIGAGIIGSFTAAVFTSRGMDTDLVEKEEQPFTGASAAAFGSLTPFSDPFFTGSARDFAARSVDLYREKWLSLLSTHRRPIVTLHDQGLLQLFADDADRLECSARAQELVAAGYESELLTSEEVRTLEPALSGEFAGALWLNEPWIDREALFSTLSDYLAESPNCRILRSQTVTKIEQQSDHSLLVQFSDLPPAHYTHIVISTGTGRVEGIPRLPLSWVRGDCIGVVTPSNLPILSRHVYLHDGFITPRADGNMLLGSTYVAEEGPPPAHCLAHRDRISVEQAYALIANNVKIVPALAQCDLVRTWRGWRPCLPDSYPVLGPDPTAPNVIHANGFIGLGVTMAPAVGEAIADYIESGSLDHFPESFRLPRSFNEKGPDAR